MERVPKNGDNGDGWIPLFRCLRPQKVIFETQKRQISLLTLTIIRFHVIRTKLNVWTWEENGDQMFGNAFRRFGTRSKDELLHDPFTFSTQNGHHWIIRIAFYHSKSTCCGKRTSLYYNGYPKNWKVPQPRKSFTVFSIDLDPQHHPNTARIR